MRSSASRLRRIALLAGLDDRHGQVLAGHLESLGWTVRAAAGGRECLSRWSELKAEVIVTDLDGRDHDGLELAGALAALQPRPALVLWTGNPWATSLDPATLGRIGVDAVVSRPARLEVVVAALLQAADAGAARTAAARAAPPVSGETLAAAGGPSPLVAA